MKILPHELPDAAKKEEPPKRRRRRAAPSTSQKLKEHGIASSAIARFRRYHQGTPKAEWSDDQIIEHLVARRTARTTRMGLRISPNTKRYKEARARAESNGVPGKLFRTRVNVHEWGLDRAATVPPGPSPKQHMTAQERDEAERMLAEGTQPKEVAERLNVTRRCVYWLNDRRRKRHKKEAT